MLELKIELTDEQFFRLCQQNRNLRFERSDRGDLIVMPPTGSETGRRNADLNFQLKLWNRQSQLGEVFDSSSGFKLPNGADRSPDAAWIERTRWQAISPGDREKFAPICPDFVVELRSPSDSLKPLQDKMAEYIEQGARLGWLLDRKKQQVEIYRPGRAVEVAIAPDTLSGEDILPGFVLDLSDIL